MRAAGCLANTALQLKTQTLAHHGSVPTCPGPRLWASKSQLRPLLVIRTTGRRFLQHLRWCPARWSKPYHDWRNTSTTLGSRGDDEHRNSSELHAASTTSPARCTTEWVSAIVSPQHVEWRWTRTTTGRPTAIHKWTNRATTSTSSEPPTTYTARSNAVWAAPVPRSERRPSRARAVPSLIHSALICTEWTCAQHRWVPHAITGCQPSAGVSGAWRSAVREWRCSRSGIPPATLHDPNGKVNGAGKSCAGADGR